MNNKIKGVLGVLIAILMVCSCAEEDEYLKFTEGGEILYTGKMDSVTVFSGRNRVQLKALLSADPKVTSYRVYWANRTDSIVFPVDPNRTNDTIIQIIDNLPENIYNFEIRTLDDQGNTSIPVFETGRVYGDRYSSSLRNRPIAESALRGDSVVIDFVESDLTSGIFTTELEYTDNNGIMNSIVVPVDSTNLVLRNFESGEFFRYRSGFKPDSTSIDNFYTPYDTIVPILPLTEAPYLENRSAPFAISDDSGQRYSTPSNWVHNAAALIYQGSYGNVDKQSANRMNIVTGYGGVPDLVNAKLFQRLNLESGTYTYTFVSQAGNWNLNDKLYVLAALGTELPDVDDIETSAQTLAFERVANGIGQTNNFTYTMSFTLTETTQVAVGLVASNVPGTSRYMPVNSFSLTKE
ncbi:DUF4998 domain-containing protein [Leeuwenhoekiella parthenopeia]|uniref:DUF5013 domain-containing protein n=1 Tax=Leeuwenhoekiella parthenopeia TaxID=2890320 RepID=A0ABS8GMQ0_9FLAO|nr:DUF4998 domain-containing protein [Leeuwenhoekiella parthenopeia]MCC4211245.1 DUF5013 domain-containing protein [Leeuwenhoekiella parthenopeia]